MRLLTLAYMFSLANKTLLLEKKKKNPHAHALGVMEQKSCCNNYIYSLGIATEAILRPLLHILGIEIQTTKKKKKKQGFGFLDFCKCI